MAEVKYLTSNRIDLDDALNRGMLSQEQYDLQMKSWNNKLKNPLNKMVFGNMAPFMNISGAQRDELNTYWREDHAYERMKDDMFRAGLNPWSGISSGGLSTSQADSGQFEAEQKLNTAKMFTSLIGSMASAGIYGSAIGLARRGAINSVRSAEKLVRYKGKQLTMAEMLAQGAYEASRNL